jgi:hypothetical protein
MSSSASSIGGLLERLYQPEYTGENRCTPCTVVNVVIAAGAGVVLGLASVPVGVAAFLVGLATIHLRGYLVPYTPTLTKRYFPDRVLRWFDKAPQAAADRGVDTAEPEDIDVSTILLEMGVIAECETVDDLCLDPAFQTATREEIADLRESDRESRAAEIATLLALDADHEIDEYGTNAAIVTVDGTHVGQWESDAALLADLAADRTLRDWDVGWEQYHVINRSRMLDTLRMFLERCPACDAPVSVGQDTVESCCRSRDVAAVTCDACGSRLFEIELTEEMQAQL